MQWPYDRAVCANCVTFIGVHSCAPAARHRRGPSAEQATPCLSDRRTGPTTAHQSKRAPRLRPLHGRGVTPRSQQGTAAGSLTCSNLPQNTSTCSHSVGTPLPSPTMQRLRLCYSFHYTTPLPTSRPVAASIRLVGLWEDGAPKPEVQVRLRSLLSEHPWPTTSFRTSV